MNRKLGPADITYCSTDCENARCKRNIMFYKPPCRYFSCSSFDKNNKDRLHLKCNWEYK